MLSNFRSGLIWILKSLIFLSVLDVSASCNLLRLRTCVDTISHLTDIIKAVAADASAADDERTSRQSSVEPTLADLTSVDNEEDIVPDLADAMAELDAVRKSSDTNQGSTSSLSQTSICCKRNEFEFALTSFII
jgi:hypothetical protein